MVTQIVILVGSMLLLPGIYAGAILLYRSSFTEEKNRKRMPLHSFQELLAVAAAYASLWRIWQECFLEKENSVFQYLQLFLMLAGMVILCMTDYWERTVPNRILLLWMLLWVAAMGLYGGRDFEGMVQHMFGVALGVIFCALSFGFCYLISRGSMGAGDVKLSIIMGLYMTGEYVVGSVLYGCILCAAYSLIMLFFKKLSRKDAIAFVPFLYAGTVLRYLIG